jgi:hypothetical protein
MTHTSTEQQIAAAWNAQADEFNQWDELDLCEKIEWAAHWGASQARVPLAMYQRNTIKANAWRETMVGGYYDANAIIDATERAHGITQEKQG